MIHFCDVLGKSEPQEEQILVSDRQGLNRAERALTTEPLKGCFLYFHCAHVLLKPKQQTRQFFSGYSDYTLEESPSISITLLHTFKAWKKG